jgi:SAM-dependent methyltransferase
MPRRCLLATAQRHLPASLDDGLLGAHRRRLLHRAGGRVLDLSAWWRPNLLAYHRGSVTSVVVTDPDGVTDRAAFELDDVPVPEVAAGLADTPTGAFDTVVVAFTLCTLDRPSELLASAALRLAPGGRLLVLDHVAGTGVTGVLQHLTNPVERALRAGCRFDLDVPAAAREAGLALADCARFRLWVAATVPTPCLAGVLVPRSPLPRGAR